MRKTLAVAIKEVRQISRDRRTLTILLFVPALFLLLYGYALNFDIRNIRLAVDDRDRTPQSRELVSAFINSGYFDLAADVTSDRELERLIDRNEARAALVIPAGYGRDIIERRPVSVQVIIDGDNSNTATTVDGVCAVDCRRRCRRRRQVWSLIDAAAQPRASCLVQPAAAQHALPGARAHCLHLDDHGGHLDGTLDRSRERARDDGAGEDVAGQPGGLRDRQDDSLSRAVVCFRASDHPRRDGAFRVCRCEGRGWFCAGRSACFSSALRRRVFSSRAWRRRSRWRFSWRCCRRFCRPSSCPGSSFRFRACRRPFRSSRYAIPARYFLVALRAIVLKGADVAAFWVDLVALGHLCGGHVDAGIGPARPGLGVIR